MIANGSVEFVGSDRSRTEAEMKKALSTISSVYFMIEPNEDWSEIHYELINSEIP